MKKKLVTIILSSTILGTAFLGTMPVVANDYNQQIDQAQREAADSEQAAENLDNLINQLSNESSNAQDALHNLNNSIQQNENKLTDAKNTLELAHQEMNELLAEIAILEENITARSAKLEEQARTIQVNGQPTTYFEFILEAESLTDIIGRIDIVTSIVKSNNSMIEDQIADQKAVEEKTEATERKIVQQDALAAELETTAAELERQRVSQTALVAQIELERSTARSDRESLIAQRDEALRRVNNLESEQEAFELAIAEANRERELVRQEEVSTTSSARQVVENNTGNEQRTPARNNNGTNQSVNTDNQNNNSSNNDANDNEAQNPDPVENPTPAPAPKPKPEPKPEPKPVTNGNVISIGNKYLGTPYLYGGSTPAAFDCSGFTQYVFREAGKSIPRSSRAQYAQATKVSNPQVGDLVFFSANGGTVTHVGIYAGGGRFLGSQTSSGVSYRNVHDNIWGPQFVGYGRF